MALIRRVFETISIHALREEGDHRDERPDRHHPISIHALREEGDINANIANGFAGVFLSTPSARRATPYNGNMFTKSFISIHALREEGDSRLFRSAYQGRGFLSTPSARRATARPP